MNITAACPRVASAVNVAAHALRLDALFIEVLSSASISKPNWNFTRAESAQSRAEVAANTNEAELMYIVKLVMRLSKR